MSSTWICFPILGMNGAHFISKKDIQIQKHYLTTALPPFIMATPSKKYVWVRSQSNEPKMTKDSKIAFLFWSFSISHKKDFPDEMLLKIHIIFSIHHIFCINFWWITKKFLKVYRFYQIMCFVLKNYPNFE